MIFGRVPSEILALVFLFECAFSNTWALRAFLIAIHGIVGQMLLCSLTADGPKLHRLLLGFFESQRPLNLFYFLCMVE